MTTFYLKKIIIVTTIDYIVYLVYNEYKYTIILNIETKFILINYYINDVFIESFGFNNNSFHKLSKISNYSIPNTVHLICQGYYQILYYDSSEIFYYPIYFYKIKPLLDSIILKNRLYQFFIFKLVFKDKLTNDIYKYAIRFL
jgi:hypothetical protein